MPRMFPDLEETPLSPHKEDEDRGVFYKETGMEITEEGRHWRCGRPLDFPIVPPKGSEVFVGNLPKDYFEREILPVFEGVGKIYMIRMMIDLDSGTNRGYCFIQYENPAEADRAVLELNDFELRAGHKIAVEKSEGIFLLFFGSVPRYKTREEIFQEISRVTEGIETVNVPLPSYVTNTSQNRGFAFVAYSTYKEAANALKKMTGVDKALLWGEKFVTAKWADLDFYVNVLLVRNLLVTTSEETIYNVFNAACYRNVSRVQKLHKSALVYFTTPEIAQQVKIQLNGTYIDGMRIEINSALPEANWKPHHIMTRRATYEFHLRTISSLSNDPTPTEPSTSGNNSSTFNLNTENNNYEPGNSNSRRKHRVRNYPYYQNGQSQPINQYQNSAPWQLPQQFAQEGNREMQNNPAIPGFFIPCISSNFAAAVMEGKGTAGYFTPSDSFPFPAASGVPGYFLPPGTSSPPNACCGFWNADCCGSRNADCCGSWNADGCGSRNADCCGSWNADGCGSRNADCCGSWNADGCGSRNADCCGSWNADGCGSRNADNFKETIIQELGRINQQLASLQFAIVNKEDLFKGAFKKDVS